MKIRKDTLLLGEILVAKGLIKRVPCNFRCT